MAEWHSPAVLAILLGAKAVVLVEDDVTDDVGSSLKTLDDSLPKSSATRIFYIYERLNFCIIGVVRVVLLDISE